MKIHERAFKFLKSVQYLKMTKDENWADIHIHTFSKVCFYSLQNKTSGKHKIRKSFFFALT